MLLRNTNFVLIVRGLHNFFRWYASFTMRCLSILLCFLTLYAFMLHFLNKNACDLTHFRENHHGPLLITSVFRQCLGYRHCSALRSRTGRTDRPSSPGMNMQSGQGGSLQRREKIKNSVELSMYKPAPVKSIRHHHFRKAKRLGAPVPLITLVVNANSLSPGLLSHHMTSQLQWSVGRTMRTLQSGVCHSTLGHTRAHLQYRVIITNILRESMQCGDCSSHKRLIVGHRKSHSNGASRQLSD